MGSRWVLGLCLVLAVGTRASAQVDVAPPRPIPSDSTGGATLPPAPLGPMVPPPSPLTFAPVPPPPQPRPVIDPGLDGWGPLGSMSQNQGWFFDAEIVVVFPQLTYRATNDAPLPNTGAILNVPVRSLTTTVLPTIEAGYRLGESLGLVAVSYSFLNSDGTGNMNLGGLDYAVKTRASINTFDIDYGTSPYEFAPRYTYSWRLGIRTSDVFFDTQARAGQTYQQASTDFFGSGPHVRFDLERRVVTIPGLSLFGRLDGAVLIGHVKQNIRYETPDAFGNVVADAMSSNSTQAVPELNLQLGLSYIVQSVPGLKFTSGYDFAEIWNVGRLGQSANGVTSNTRGQLLTNGWFVRGQFDF